jgi:hypothetical protein
MTTRYSHTDIAELVEDLKEREHYDQFTREMELALSFVEGLIADALESAWAEEMFGPN